MKHAFGILFLIGVLISTGCAGARRYLAPTSEDFARDAERQKCEREKSEDSFLLHVLGWGLYYGAPFFTQ